MIKTKHNTWNPRQYLGWTDMTVLNTNKNIGHHVEIDWFESTSTYQFNTFYHVFCTSGRKVMSPGLSVNYCAVAITRQRLQVTVASGMFYSSKILIFKGNVCFLSVFNSYGKLALSHWKKEILRKYVAENMQLVDNYLRHVKIFTVVVNTSSEKTPFTAIVVLALQLNGNVMMQTNVKIVPQPNQMLMKSSQTDIYLNFAWMLIWRCHYSALAITKLAKSNLCSRLVMWLSSPHITP